MHPFLPNHFNESQSEVERRAIQRIEPRAQRTFTPSHAVLAHSAGIYHWTPEGRRLFDFTSGVLVANLGHNPVNWLKRFAALMGWPTNTPPALPITTDAIPSGFFPAVTLTAYNAITPIERLACEKLLTFVQRRNGGQRLEQVLWAASGAEAVQKALWASLARDRSRPMILATRHGFHGKKGLAGAVTGSENDRERDPRVVFVSFPMSECADVSMRNASFDSTPYHRELDDLWRRFGRQIGTLITEPYLGGGGSYHPPAPYLQLLQTFCRQHDIVFILDEVQSNFGRTGQMFAFETYGLEPDIVVLGKGLGNGVPVAAALGCTDVFAALDYGEGSDTWSANPLCCAGVLATLEAFDERDVLASARDASAIIENGLVQWKRFPFIQAIRGEQGGMVWGVETCDYAGLTAAEWANQLVLTAYRGDSNGEGIHLLGR